MHCWREIPHMPVSFSFIFSCCVSIHENRTS